MNPQEIIREVVQIGGALMLEGTFPERRIRVRLPMQRDDLIELLKRNAKAVWGLLQPRTEKVQ
jgi:hypothetical protein